MAHARGAVASGHLIGGPNPVPGRSVASPKRFDRLRRGTSARAGGQPDGPGSSCPDRTRSIGGRSDGLRPAARHLRPARRQLHPASRHLNRAPTLGTSASAGVTPRCRTGAWRRGSGVRRGGWRRRPAAAGRRARRGCAAAEPSRSCASGRADRAGRDVRTAAVRRHRCGYQMAADPPPCAVHWCPVHRSADHRARSRLGPAGPGPIHCAGTRRAPVHRVGPHCAGHRVTAQRAAVRSVAHPSPRLAVDRRLLRRFRRGSTHHWSAGCCHRRGDRLCRTVDRAADQPLEDSHRHHAVNGLASHPHGSRRWGTTDPPPAARPSTGRLRARIRSAVPAGSRCCRTS